MQHCGVFIPKLLENISFESLRQRPRGFEVCILLGILLGTTTASAETLPDYWQCATTDQNNRSWTAQHAYQRMAINQAFEQCKKESTSPATCSASKNACDFFSNGQNSTPMWHCTALDQMNKAWPSRPYRNRDDAAIAARAYCEQKSGFPDSCYVNLLTCKTRSG